MQEFLLKKRKQNRGLVPNIEREHLGIWNILALCTGKLIPYSNSAIYYFPPIFHMGKENI